MEELLNKLIEKGWLPFGHYDRMYLSDKSSYQYHKVEGIRSYFFVKGNGVGNHFTLRQLVSKESLLWQFVCENGMVKEHTSLDKETRWRKVRPYDAEWENKYMYNTYQYRLIESALKDESELESFILDNIKL